MKRKTHRVEYFENGKRYIATMDSETGEEINRTEAILNKPIQNDYKPGEFYMRTKNFEMFLIDKYHEYNKLEFGVLSFLLSNIEMNNRVKFFRQQEIADILKTSQGHISTSLKRLTKDGIIKKDGHHYVINYKQNMFAFDKTGGKQHVQQIFSSDMNEPEEFTNSAVGGEANEVWLYMAPNILVDKKWGAS